MAERTQKKTVRVGISGIPSMMPEADHQMARRTMTRRTKVNRADAPNRLRLTCPSV
jgi:hypothetical protein